MDITHATEITASNATLTALAPAMLAFLGVIAANLLSRRSTGRWETMHLIQWSVDLIAAGGRRLDIGITLLNTIAKSGLVAKSDVAFVRAVSDAAESWKEEELAATPPITGISSVTIANEEG